MPGLRYRWGVEREGGRGDVCKLDGVDADVQYMDVRAVAAAAAHGKDSDSGVANENHTDPGHQQRGKRGDGCRRWSARVGGNG